MAELTPMMKQYLDIKKQYPGTVLFFRLGDFYEMFQSDAKEVSQILNITLTNRHGIPMCGIPYHAAQNYINRLLKAGKKIAMCEQTEMPGKDRKIAKREVVEVITPGTVVDSSYLNDKSNNYLCAIGSDDKFISLSAIDLSTGDFTATSFPIEGSQNRIRKELFALNPQELILQESLAQNEYFSFINDYSFYINRYPDWYFQRETGYIKLKEQFKTASLKGFGFGENDPEFISAGVILTYLEETSKALLPHIRMIKKEYEGEYVVLDEATQRNLELVRNLREGTTGFTLLEVLDHTKSAAGGRLIQKWLLRPLNKKDQIIARREKVDFFYSNQTVLAEIRELLGSILDLERLATRVAMDRAHGKDLLSILMTLQQTDRLINLLSESSGPFLQEIIDVVGELKSIKELLDVALYEEPPILLTEGRLVKKGYSAEVDTLRDLRDNSKKIIDDYLEEEKTQTGIGNLKIKYNRIIGYFFDVPKGGLDLIPSHFIRRQSLVSSERFSTERLGVMESEINSASDKLTTLEQKIFIEMRNRVKEKISDIQLLARILSELDSIQSLAYAATVNGYVKPSVSEQGELYIVKGRHPVVEFHMPHGEFIPNSLDVAGKDDSFLLVTGPNMAGKSTFLRQTALLVLMAQIGSYVPAEEAVIGIVDRIFCRVGASDNLARGESTFLVEMNEAANILRNATEKSLIIMDEVGRGTGTNDGLAIAWSISEYILNTLCSRTLFATHYHELSGLNHKRCRNLSMAVEERNGEIVFLKRIQNGAASSSYGIHVASLAGIPKEVLVRATELLLNMSTQEKVGIKTKQKSMVIEQPSLFSEEKMILNDINAINLNSTTPLDVVRLLASIQDKIKKAGL